MENGKLTIPKKRTEPVQEDWKENEAVEVEDGRCLRDGEILGEDFLDRHQFQIVALALRMEGEVSCLRDREREERSEGDEREAEK